MTLCVTHTDEDILLLNANAVALWMLEFFLAVSVTAGICVYGCMYVMDMNSMYACVCVGIYESFSVVLQCHLQPLSNRAAQSRWPNASSGLPLTLAVGSESASSAHFSCVCVCVYQSCSKPNRCSVKVREWRGAKSLVSVRVCVGVGFHFSGW